MKGSAAAILIFVALAAGGYVWYRGAQSGVGNLNNLRGEGRPLPASVCTGAAGGFEYMTSDMLHYDGYKMRNDGTQVIGGNESEVHYLWLGSGPVYVWGRTHYANVTGDDAFSYKISTGDFNSFSSSMKAIFSAGSCAPWWFADASMFTVPDLPFPESQDVTKQWDALSH